MTHALQQLAGSGSQDFTLEGADVLVLISSSFGETRLDHPEVGDQLVRALDAHKPGTIFVFSDSKTSAATACTWLNIDIERGHGIDLASCYGTSVYTYSRTSGKLTIYCIAPEGILKIRATTKSHLLIQNAITPFPKEVREAFS